MDGLTDATRGIGALAEPTRRALYRYVAAQPHAVGREEAAAAVGVPVPTARFHLDRLAADGLLDVEFRRLGGRSGPGAGRPAKLYRRAEREVAVSLPPRRYDLVGHILAAGVERALAGEPLRDATRAAAAREGRAAAASRAAPADTGEPGDTGGTGEAGDAGATAELARLGRALETHGYEPRLDAGGDRLLLGNCPFDALAREHTEVVCSLNHAYVAGLAEGLGCRAVDARLEPGAGRCCVAAYRRAQDAGDRR
ncbi:helix-turn-helix transcriptional regulator [Puerhibacterium puerhi]|uniref:helix-turn-helix transcriptional regulator n=1 Tax=Puerhibacterium puerhi TaxID=2692623 RepID=UPI00135B34BC|nr:helix-turn-helix domain-containing protein [Puerhibacterium puerhi]